jgi:hypothetical protein
MSRPEVRVAFEVAFAERRAATRRDPAPPRPSPRPDRAASRARTLALAYWIDHLIRSGKVEDQAAVARMCCVSRACVSKVVSLLGAPAAEQERLLGPPD